MFGPDTGDMQVNDNFIRSIEIEWPKISERSYLRDIEPLAHMGRLDFAAPVTLFVGENGSGKSTLLEAIAVAYGFNPEGGTVNYRFSTYDDVSELCGAQFIIASHSPILLGISGADIVSFDGGRMERCAYEDTESYQVMELFINHRAAMLGRLLGE